MTPMDEDRMRELEEDALEMLRMQYLDQLESDSVSARRDALHRIRKDQWTAGIPHLLRLLEDDAPYVFDVRGELHIAEVRADVVETLEELYRVRGVAPECGPVKVSAPMPTRTAIAQADKELARLSPAERAAVSARVHDFMQQRYSYSPEQEDALRAYRALQEIGRISYRLETIDPVIYLTPLQQEIIAGQTRSPRPKPHLRISRSGAPAETLGWLYRDPATRKWIVDFSDARDAQDIAEWVTRVLGDLDRAGVPRVARDDEGRPRRDTDGSFVLDGVISLETTDPVELLRSVQAFVEDEALTELVA